MTQPHPSKAAAKIYLVDRGFQVKLALKGAVIGLVSSIFGLAVVWYPLHLFERLPLGMTLPPVIYAVIALAVIANIAAIVSFGIRISHRVAGPVYSIVRHMRRVEEGEKVGLLKARQSDDLKYLVRNYNNLLVGLELSRAEQVKELTAIHKALKAEAHDANDRREALGRLEALIVALAAKGLDSLPQEVIDHEAARAAHFAKADKDTHS